jgi:hypothetical protein
MLHVYDIADFGAPYYMREASTTIEDYNAQVLELQNKTIPSVCIDKQIDPSSLFICNLLEMFKHHTMLLGS